MTNLYLKRCLLLLITFLITYNLSAQDGVSINTDGSDPDPSAILDVKSSDKGLLIPRLTEVEKNNISNPATGLLIFQTNGNAGFYYNAGSPSTPSWEKIGDNSALSATLNNGNIFVGNASNQATGVNMSGDATISNNGTITISDDAINSNKILDGAVVNTKIQDGAVSTSKIANNAVDGTKINLTGNSNGDLMYYDGTNWVRLASGSNGEVLKIVGGVPTWGADNNTTYNGSTSIVLDGNSFERAALTGDVTAPLNSNTTTISDNAITTSKINNGAVTNAKLENMTANTIKGRISTAGTPQDLTGNQVKTILGLDDAVIGTGANNKVAFWDGTGTINSNNNFHWDNGNQRLGIGTASPNRLLTISGPTSPQVRINNPNSGVGATAGIWFDTGSSWEVQLRTRQGTSWLEITNNVGTVQHRWDNINYYPGNSSAYITRGSGNENIAVMGGGLGIGTGIPQASLHVAGDALVTGDLKLPNASGSSNTLRIAENHMISDHSGTMTMYSNRTTGAGGEGSFKVRSHADFGNYRTDMMIDEDGNMGIGNTNPSERLDINGLIRIRGGNPGNGRVLVSNATGVGSWQDANGLYWSLEGNSGTNPTSDFIGTTDNVNLSIRTNNVTRFTFTNNGRLRAHVNGTAAQPAYAFNGASGETMGMYRLGANILGFSTNSTERMRITANGNIGIGNNNPVGYLHVQQSSSTNPTLRVQHDSNGNNDVALDIHSQGQVRALITPSGVARFNNGSAANPSYSFTDNDNMGMYRIGNNILGLATNGSERIRINAAGQVGIGTNLPNSTLHVRAETGGQVPLRVQIGGSSRFTVASNGGATIGDFQNNPPERGLYVFGDVRIGTNSPTEKLHVNGTTRFGNAPGITNYSSPNVGGVSVDAELRFGNATSSDDFINGEYQPMIYGTRSGGGGGFGSSSLVIQAGGTSSNRNIYMRTGNENRLFIQHDGNVGIGQDNPDGKLHISIANNANEPVIIDKANGTGSGPIMEWYGFSTTHRLQLNYVSGDYEFNTDDGLRDIRFAPNNTQTLIIRGSGRVGVSTTAPTTELDVDGQIRIRGGNPGVDKVLTSNVNGTATWEELPSKWTLILDNGTGFTTVPTTDATWTSIPLGYTPSNDGDRFMIEFSNSTFNQVEKGISIVGHGTFSGTNGMSVVSYQAYDGQSGGVLNIATYAMQWRINGSNIEFRYPTKITQNGTTSAATLYIRRIWSAPKE